MRKTIDDIDMDFKKRSFECVPKITGEHTEWHYSLNGRPVSLGKKLNYVSKEVQILKDREANDFEKWLVPKLAEAAKSGEFMYKIDAAEYGAYEFSEVALGDWCKENELSAQIVKDTYGRVSFISVCWGRHSDEHSSY